MTAAEWLTSDEVTAALAKIKEETTMSRQPISQWVSQNDPDFEEPVLALEAGYTLAELAGEYERTFHTPELAAHYMMQDLVVYFAERPVPQLPPLAYSMP